MGLVILLLILLSLMQCGCVVYIRHVSTPPIKYLSNSCILMLLDVINYYGTILFIVQYSDRNTKTIIRWNMGPSRQFTVKNGGENVVAFFGSDTDR